MFTRMRLICEGVVIQDLNYQDRQHQWLTEDMSKEQHEEHMKEHFADCGKALGGDAASRLEGHLTAHRAKLTEGLSGGGGGPLATPDILAI